MRYKHCNEVIAFEISLLTSATQLALLYPLKLPSTTIMILRFLSHPQINTMSVTIAAVKYIVILSTPSFLPNAKVKMSFLRYVNVIVSLLISRTTILLLSYQCYTGNWIPFVISNERNNFPDEDGSRC